jgi:ubiquinone/menaquinone biosynthesis C-methylase UbiE
MMPPGPTLAGVLDYDAEAPGYDQSRGGPQRARAAATAIASLIPRGGILVDVGGGTGIVSRQLADLGWSVIVADASTGMLQLARTRLPGTVVRASATRLPLRNGSVEVVTAIWLLHLLTPDQADAVLAEAARVLRPGGHLVTTVDKQRAHSRAPATRADHRTRLEQVAAGLGLHPVGQATFTGRSHLSPTTGPDPTFQVLALRKP